MLRALLDSCDLTTALDFVTTPSCFSCPGWGCGPRRSHACVWRTSTGEQVSSRCGAKAVVSITCLFPKTSDKPSLPICASVERLLRIARCS